MNKPAPPSLKKADRSLLVLSKDLLLKMYRMMWKSRLLEERLIQVYRQGESFFWIGGPGEEAFGVPLGLLVRKGEGIKGDWLHLHYRALSTLVAMGMDLREALRLGMSKATDPHTGGRNFVSHFCVKKWNVAPVNSVVSSQYSMALGTAHVQARTKNNTAISIVTGGDGGTAEGDFASCLVWASKPSRPLPLLVTVQNNGWGISTAYQGMHGESRIVDRGRAFNIKTVCVDSLCPVQTYIALRDSMEYIRRTRRPVLMEVRVRRLYGHSSASGAARVPGEDCPVRHFEERLIKQGLVTRSQCKRLGEEFYEEIKKLWQEVRTEPDPEGSSVWENVYAEGENADFKKF